MTNRVYKTIKAYLKPLTPAIVQMVWKKHLECKQLHEWRKQGCPSPPPHIVKQRTIREYQKKFNTSVLIETGTYLGDMIEAQKKHFKKVISIELGSDLYKNAVQRFIRDNNVLIVHGDSGKVLPKVLSDIHEPTLFWLDGHYSAGITAKGEKECPIFEELDAIFHHGHDLNHVLLIDDARCFNGENDYPTIKQFEDIAESVPLVAL